MHKSVIPKAVRNSFERGSVIFCPIIVAGISPGRIPKILATRYLGKLKFSVPRYMLTISPGRQLIILKKNVREN